MSAQVTGAHFTTGQTQIRRGWRLSITADAVLQKQGANTQKVRTRKSGLIALAEKAILYGQELLQPAVAYRIMQVRTVQSTSLLLENELELKSATVARKFANGEFIIGVIATIGDEIEQEIHRAAKNSAAFALALDGYANATVSALILALRHDLAERAAGAGLKLTTPLYPGTHGWELAAAQKELFTLVDGLLIDVTLTDSFLMRPRKSVSMLMGAGARAKPATEVCDECEVAPTCRYKPAKV